MPNVTSGNEEQITLLAPTWGEVRSKRALYGCTINVSVRVVRIYTCGRLRTVGDSFWDGGMFFPIFHLENSHLKSAARDLSISLRNLDDDDDECGMLPRLPS